MAFRALHAKNAKVRINGTVVTAHQWNVTAEVDELETTNFEGNGFHECIAGIKRMHITIELADNALLNYFDAGITSGTIVTNVYLYLNDTAGPKWVIPSMLVKSIGYKADVREKHALTIQGTGSGTFTYPTGTMV